ncbi:MAG: hypothetical protein HQ565_03375 [Bacteroidetes bacterium]|nr:hypothetical protein [Bacteroidota bacterium]
MKKIFTILLSIMLISPALVNAQGCMEPSSDDGVSVIGFIQPEFQYDFGGIGKEDFDVPLDYNSFKFRRARLGVTGNVPYDITYYVMAEFGNYSMTGEYMPYLLDAFITYNRLGPWVNITMGQFKSPFGLELNTACHKLHTIKRSMVVNELASPFRDIGIMFSGGTDSLSFFGLNNHNIITYKFAILNGTGKNMWDNNSSKDIVARIVLSPWKFIRLGGSYRSGKQPPGTAGSDKDDERSRYGGDIELEFGNFLFQGEYIWGEDIGSKLVGGGCGGEDEVVIGTFISSGYFGQVMYMTPWRLQPLLKYETYDTYNKYEDDTDAMISTITVGLNYWINDWTRVQLNYLYHDKTTDLAPNDNDSYFQYYQSQFIVQAQVNF